MRALPENLPPILERIAEKENFVNFTINFGSGSNVGDNFSGDLVSAIISGRRKQKDDKEVDAELSLLCKLAPANAQRRKELECDVFFERESYFYNTVAPTFTRFQQERGLSEEDQFKAFPKCYEAVYDPENGICVIIMEDLRTKGFAMWPKQKPAPASYCRLFVREMAKFHAISFAMKDQQPERFEEFKKLNDLTNVYVKVPNKVEFFWNSCKRVIGALENENHKDIVRDIQNNIPAYVASCLGREAANRFGVISHGDCWNNNFLYRPNEKGAVDEISFVDWQMIRYASPVIDLLNNFFASTDKKTRDEAMEDLFREYYEQLSSNIRKMDSDPEKLFPFEAFEKELMLCGSFGFLMPPIVIEISQVDAKDVVNMDELCEKMANGEGGESMSLVQGLSDSAQFVYNKRINECIGDLVERGYFQKV